MPQVIQLRRAVPADIPAIMRMKAALMTLDGLADLPSVGTQQWLYDVFGSERRFFVVVAEGDNIVIGMAIYSPMPITGCAEPVAHLQDLFVEEAHRRHGIGWRLLQWVAADARERGMAAIELNVRADSPACEFYRRIGFEHVPQCHTYVAFGPTVIKSAERASTLAFAV